MMGMWRYVAKGHTGIFEPHQTPGSERRSASVTSTRSSSPGRRRTAGSCPLVAKGPREAVFEVPEYGLKGTVRLTYRRGDDDALTAVLEKEGAKQEFRFRRR
jgi:hypothetical protein